MELWWFFFIEYLTETPRWITHKNKSIYHRGYTNVPLERTFWVFVFRKTSVNPPWTPVIKFITCSPRKIHIVRAYSDAYLLQSCLVISYSLWRCPCASNLVSDRAAMSVQCRFCPTVDAVWNTMLLTSFSHVCGTICWENEAFVYPQILRRILCFFIYFNLSNHVLYVNWCCK